MKRIFLFFIVAFGLQAGLKAQYSLRLVVTGVATKSHEDIFVAGNFNGWKEFDHAYKLKPFGPGRRGIVLKNLAPGKYEFKFTRGSFNYVETNAKGEDINNRTVELKEDMSIDDIKIEGWKDDFPEKPKPNTATASVKILSNEFDIPQLGRKRRVWIYLPRSYSQLKGKTFPVLYMHDGQNLFNEQTAAFGEWGVDEALDSLQVITGREMIVVGIDNGGEKRLTEYNPYDHEQYGKGEGKAYVDFIVKTLKPYVDKNYRTAKEPKYTFIAGSSMGGVISLYATIANPNVFGAAGIFSPAFWVTPQLYKEVENSTWTSVPRFYFYAGGKESSTMVNDMERMVKLVQAKKSADTRISVYPLGQHNESAWRNEFRDFYLWLARGIK